MDNAATMNQEIDDEIMSLKDMGVEFPDSYSEFSFFVFFYATNFNLSLIHIVSAYEKSSKESNKNTDSFISKRTSVELHSSTSEEDSGGGGTLSTTPGDKIGSAAVSLLTSIQKRSLDLASDDGKIGNESDFGATSNTFTGHERYKLERRNSKQHNGKHILADSVSYLTKYDCAT